MVRTGLQYAQSLKDGRQIFINGEIAGDLAEHPAFRRTLKTVGGLFDFAARRENADLMTFEPPDATGGRASRIWQLPQSYEDLVQRRRALEAWAELHAGFLGRSPDHVASCLSGMVMGLDVFEAYDAARAGALADYHRYARDNDLYLTYVLINPQADRSKAIGEQQDPFLTAGVVDQDKDGITIRGGKMLATGGVFADEVFVTCIQPLRENEAAYAIAFAAPMNSKGLKILSRRSYEEGATSVFDYPLASRFDENDAVLFFDDVKVPWDRVFVNQDVAMCQKQFHATPAHVFQNYQAQVRLMVKMRFLVGVAKRIAETNGVGGFPQVRELLGTLAAQNTTVDALVHAMEIKGHACGPYFVPDAHTLYSAQVLTQQLYAQVTVALRELAGGGMIMLPSSVHDFANSELRALIDKTQQSPVASSEDRVKFFKLAWDAVGSEFASRHTQYEMFYAGANFVTKGHSFRTFDWDRCTQLVDRMLDGYSLADELSPSKPLAA
jgi:4-hydroxyphenylacetate 3-monooxygenase